MVFKAVEMMCVLPCFFPCWAAEKMAWLSASLPPGEQDLALFAIQALGNTTSGIFQGLFCFLTDGVQAGRVAIKPYPCREAWPGSPSDSFGRRGIVGINLTFVSSQSANRAVER